jgi:hypothetical protein
LYAFPCIEVEGFVNPSAVTVTDRGDGTTYVANLIYSFTVTYSWFEAEMDALSLRFSNDVFKEITLVNYYLPSNWTHKTFVTNDNSYLLSLGGSTIGVGETLSFSLDTVMFSQALGNPSFWEKGQLWVQSWTAGDTLGGGDGGTTAPVPEPTAMLLFGTGLVVSGFLGKKFKKI